MNIVKEIMNNYKVREEEAEEMSRIAVLDGVNLEDSIKLLKLKEIDREAVIALSKACNYSIDSSIEILNKMKAYGAIEKAV